MKRISFAAIALIALLSTTLHAQETTPGQFIKRYWYQQGLEHGNPNFNQSIRVSSPDIMLHPLYGKRVEARGNGMIQVLAEEELDQIESAALYLELWGGHPGTAAKAMTVNGRSTYAIPEVGTAKGHCTYHYPLIPVEITDLVNGYNVFQFSCQAGFSFWGHFLMDNACLVLTLKGEHTDLVAAGLQGFEASVVATVQSADAIELQLALSEMHDAEIDYVEYYGYYEGFDENGNGLETDWHGYTKRKVPQHHLGRSDTAPFNVVWNTAMLKPQHGVKVKAEVHFKDRDRISYLTPETTGLKIPVRTDTRIDRFRSHDLPVPFWSRANKLNTCTIVADVVPGKIDKAELHILIWDGGEGGVKDHFKFNGVPLQLASGKSAHDVIYRIFELDPAWIRAGENTIELLSDTEHHGIEVLLPGPELVIKSTK